MLCKRVRDAKNTYFNINLLQMLSVEKYIGVWIFIVFFLSDLIKCFKIAFSQPSPLTSADFNSVCWLTLRTGCLYEIKLINLYSHCYAFQWSFKMLMNKRVPKFPTGAFCCFPVSYLVGHSNHKAKTLFRIKNTELQLIQSKLQ